MKNLKKNRLSYFKIIPIVFLFCYITLGFENNICASNTNIISFKPNKELDMTPLVRKAIENNKNNTLHLIFAPGSYFFKPDFAVNKYEAIINHDNGMKSIVFNIANLNNVTIESTGAEFYFHGREMPFQFKNCSKVTVSGIRIHWDIPFLFAGEVIAINKKEGWREIKPINKKGKWEVKKGRLFWPNIDGFCYNQLGSTLPFTKVTKAPIDSASDYYSHETKVEKRPGGIIRIYEHMSHYPPVGSILNSKGDKEGDRYAPAFRAVRCNNLLYKNVVVHHALGMAYLYEFCDNITLDHCDVLVEKDSPEVVSSTADASHFNNCKGDILINGCHFENMLDDGVNVHGTYVSVIKRLTDKTVRVAFMHNEQQGGIFAQPKDSVWFIHQPNPNRLKQTAVVKNINIINEKYQDITFNETIPASLENGDVLENKTWNPTFTLRNSIIRDNRARNVILKTPKKIIVEDNSFSSMMSSILLRGETFYWFESGAVTDVTIRHNHFSHCAYCAQPHAVLFVTPRLGKQFDSHALFDSNISFVNNTIESFQPRIIWAYNVDGLKVEGNKITQTYETKPTQGDAPLFDLHYCKDVSIQYNEYMGSHKNLISADQISKKTLIFKDNKVLNSNK